MTRPIVFILPGNEATASAIIRIVGADQGQAEIRHFPDAETYVRIDSLIEGREVIFVCTLDRPDIKLLPLQFLARLAKDMHASRVGLVAPYLPYMRQDRQFQPGEAVTSTYFAEIISSLFNWVVTVDPHLHRRQSLAGLYTIPTYVVHAAPYLGAWIREHVSSPLLVGPDVESAQWVNEISTDTGSPMQVFAKTRRGDRDVAIEASDISEWRAHTPVVIDDIISTGQTMIETVRGLIDAGMKRPVCVGIHAVFADAALNGLRAAGTTEVFTTNTITHETNAIDIVPAIADAVKEVMAG